MNNIRLNCSKDLISTEKKINFYRLMIRIRLFEKKVNELFLKGYIPGTIHLYIGQEAVAVGVISALKKEDLIVTNHRPHGHAIAKGIDLGKLMAEILGRVDGCCMGLGGSMHIADVKNGIMPSDPIVGAGIPIADGLAFANKFFNNNAVAISFFGDSATNIGAFHEGLNLAAIWKLPVVFICENNLYGVSTPISTTTMISDLAERSKSYGMPGLIVDGNSVESVYLVAKDAIEKARSGLGPSLIECKTYRQGGHSRNDPGTYRSRDEVDQWLKNDPIKKYEKELVQKNLIGENQIKVIEESEQKLIDSAAEYAVSSPEPKPEEVLTPFLEKN